MPLRDDIIRSFTEEQKRIYDNVLGDLEGIHKGWLMCRKFYADAQKVIDDKTTGPEVRLFLMNTVLKFWMGRMRGIETLLNFAGHPELVPAWKKEFNASK